MKIKGIPVGTTMPRPDWNQTDPKKADYILNKPIPDTTYITPKMYGAKGDGTTDDTGAIQAMFDDVAGEKKVYFPSGKYRTTATINVPAVPDIEMDGMIIANHNGAALVLGQAATYNYNKSIKVKVTKSGTKYANGSIGLVVGAFARSTFNIEFVNGFEINVKLSCNGGKGIFFNTFHLDDLNDYGFIGLDLDGTKNWIDGTTTDTDGWINDNLFIGGSIVRSATSTATDKASVRINNGGSNVFFKTGMEGNNNTSAHVVYGHGNTFLYSRCENSTIALRVDDGRYNTMLSGYGTVFQNNSKYCTSGVKSVAENDVCKYHAVDIQSIDESKILTVGNKIITEYCRFINASSGAIQDETNASNFTVNDGVLKKAGSWYPVFEFDTTKNKRFNTSALPYFRVGLYNKDGRVIPTEETLSKYIKYEKLGGNPTINTNLFGGCIAFSQCTCFEVSEEITKIDIAIVEGADGSAGYSHFDIRTEYPCKPIRNEILTVSALPSNGYIGASVIFNGALYIYNGTEWKAV